MAFVNELIPNEDVERFCLKEIDKHFVVGGTNARDWTIDHDRDIHLRNVRMAAEMSLKSQTRLPGRCTGKATY